MYPGSADSGPQGSQDPQGTEGPETTEWIPVALRGDGQSEEDGPPGVGVPVLEEESEAVVEEPADLDMTAVLDALERRMTSRHLLIEQRLGVLSSLESRLDGLDSELARQVQRSDGLGRRFDAVDETLAQRIGRGERELAELGTEIRSRLEAELADRSEATADLFRRLEDVAAASRRRERDALEESKGLAERLNSLVARVDAIASRAAEETETRLRLSEAFELKVDRLAGALERLAAAELDRREELAVRFDGIDQLDSRLSMRIEAQGETLAGFDAALQRAAEASGQSARGLEARLRAVEEGLAGLAGASDPPAPQHPEPQPPQPQSPGFITPSPSPSPSPAEPAPERLDLNVIRFEQLRRLGLSSTQASRVLAARELLGGFSDLDQFDAVAGIPAETKERLKLRLLVD